MIDETFIIKESVRVKGNGRPTRIYHNEIEDDLKKGQVKNALNRQDCTKA